MKAKNKTTAPITTKPRAVALLLCVISFAVALSGCAANSAGNSELKPQSMDTAPTGNGANYLAAPSPYYDDDFSYQGEQYLDIIEQGERLVAQNPKITLSLKVDTAAYSNVQRYIDDRRLPPADAVRTEELINYFDYDQDLQFDRRSPFAIYTELGQSPFDSSKQLAFIRVKTADINKEELPPSNLVFLIDTSGSMDSYDKLPLLQNAFSLLTDTLDQNDRVSIVTYAGSSEVVLDGVRGSDTRRIDNAIHNLTAGGSTAGAKGIQTAYALAQENFIKGGNNRVILATDGDFNVGLSDTDDLSRFIGEKRQTGVYLSILGFGSGNIRDDIMETLSKEGNGNYSYIDSQQTAKKVLVNELGSNLFTVADDVKSQIEFNPDVVESYRLIGYENRTMDNKDFENDRKDAGEIGAGSDVIVLFELDLINQYLSPFAVNIRYKNPGDSQSQLLTITADPISGFRQNSTDFGFASSVALFGDILRHPDRTSSRQLNTAIDLAKSNLGKDLEGYRADYLNMLNRATDLL